MGLLEGKWILITGVARRDSIATSAAERAMAHGAHVILAAFPRDLAAAENVAATLPKSPVAVLAADLTAPEDLLALEADVASLAPHLDAALHAVAFAPAAALASVLDVEAGAVELAFRTSTHSYASLAGVLSRLAPPAGASLVGLDFDSDRAWPVYNWMGPCKAALRSLNQYLARDLGPRNIRANLVAAGPLCTRAAGGIPGFEELLRTWQDRAPLGWDPNDAVAVADAVCLLFSDLARTITGEVLHADGGAHAMAAARVGTV
jgi:meromycolic acid enoyl-[acyl-carrier-protein] reductase